MNSKTNTTAINGKTRKKTSWSELLYCSRFLKTKCLTIYSDLVSSLCMLTYILENKKRRKVLLEFLERYRSKLGKQTNKKTLERVETMKHIFL